MKAAQISVNSVQTDLKLSAASEIQCNFKVTIAANFHTGVLFESGRSESATVTCRVQVHVVNATQQYRNREKKNSNKYLITRDTARKIAETRLMHSAENHVRTNTSTKILKLRTQTS